MRSKKPVDFIGSFCVPVEARQTSRNIMPGGDEKSDWFPVGRTDQWPVPHCAPTWQRGAGDTPAGILQFENRPLNGGR